ncbi:MAG: alpha/beta fold hydrolase [Candidatus Lokiarchaeota archaeon]|nr:alpha/beta fold hydrolase [Candidatus Lokiarchaeota archaeon]MBD3201610.1 alpha/beta fold hydrolase [Candidatus Lokiarchaeota archaeon]
MKELFTKVNGINICYTVNGEGEPLFLVHGYGGRKEDWIPQIKTLKKYYKTICFDNRCSGKSQHPNELITMKMFAKDLYELMKSLNINKANVAGRSLGGMIVQQFIIDYPERVDKAILINTNYSGEMGEIITATTVESATKEIKDPERAFWDNAMLLYHSKFRRELKKNPDKKFYNLFTLQDLIKKLEENNASKEDLINQGHAFKNFNSLSQLEHIQNQVLLIGASHDRILPNSQMYEMNDVIPNSTFRLIKKAGHGSPLSRAPEINDIIIEFLNS